MIIDDAAQRAIIDRLDAFEADIARRVDMLEVNHRRRERQVDLLTNSDLEQHEAIRQIIKSLKTQNLALQVLAEKFAGKDGE